MGYVVGVDGGGTKTAGLLANLEGRVLAGETVGPTNYQIVGQEGIQKEIPLLVDRLFASAGLPREELAGIALGLAGVGRPGEPETVTGLVEGLQLARQVVVDHDAMIALVGALGDQPGLIVIAGTGSIVLGRNARGQRVRVGGWGYLLGDEGSGFYIARQALVAVLRAFDGRDEKTDLTERILGHLGLQSPEELIPRIYRQGMSHTEMADLTPLVFGAAGEGDAVALRILSDAGRELGQMISAAIRQLEMEEDAVKVGMVGSLFKSRELLLDGIRDGLKGQAVGLVVPRLDPVGGAVILALKATGVEIADDVLRQLEEGRYFEQK
jgi:N-acetylglucosamine kinase